MNVLLVYPQFPETFWSFTYALSFICKKTAFPPLGLLTVAALLPDGWNKRLVDLNVQVLAGLFFRPSRRNLQRRGEQGKVAR